MLEIALNLQIGDTGFKALAESSIATQLRVLHIGGLGLTSLSFTKENFNKFTSLQKFIIAANPLGEGTFASLVNSDLCKTIQEIDVRHTGLPEDSLSVMKNYCYLKTR